MIKTVFVSDYWYAAGNPESGVFSPGARHVMVKLCAAAGMAFFSSETAAVNFFSGKIDERDTFRVTSEGLGFSDGVKAAFSGDPEKNYGAICDIRVAEVDDNYSLKAEEEKTEAIRLERVPGNAGERLYREKACLGEIEEDNY
jgi:hypothetical protein